MFIENNSSNTFVFTVRRISETNTWNSESKECLNAYPINWVQTISHGDTAGVEELLQTKSPKIILVDIWRDEIGIERDVRRLVGLKGNHLLIFPSLTKFDNLTIVLANRESNVITPRLWRTEDKRGVTNILKFARYIRKYLATNFVNMAKTYEPGEKKKLADVIGELTIAVHGTEHTTAHRKSIAAHKNEHTTARGKSTSSERRTPDGKSTIAAHRNEHTTAHGIYIGKSMSSERNICYRKNTTLSERKNSDGKSTTTAQESEHTTAHKTHIGKSTSSAHGNERTTAHEIQDDNSIPGTRREKISSDTNVKERRKFLRLVGQMMERSGRKRKKFRKRTRCKRARKDITNSDTDPESNESSSSSSGSENSSSTSESSSNSSSSSSSSESSDSSSSSSSSESSDSS